MKTQVLTFDPLQALRTYHYSDGATLTFANVISSARDPDDWHYLHLASGQKVIVPTGWLCCVIEGGPEWDTIFSGDD